jgi:hypothetical protein
MGESLIVEFNRANPSQQEDDDRVGCHWNRRKLLHPRDLMFQEGETPSN